MIVECNKTNECLAGKKCNHYGMHEKDGTCVGIDVPCEMAKESGKIVFTTCVPVDTSVLKSDPKIYDKAQKRLCPLECESK